MNPTSENGGQPETPGGLSPNYNNSLGRPSLYDTYYLRTYQNYLSGDRLPSENHFRNIGSVADHQLRPTLEEIREKGFDVKKVSGLVIYSFTARLMRSFLYTIFFQERVLYKIYVPSKFRSSIMRTLVE